MQKIETQYIKRSPLTGATASRVDQITCTLIDHIVSMEPNSLFGTEVRLLGGRRRADVITLSNRIRIFEIKTAQDNTQRLNDQVRDMMYLCDELYVVCETNNIDYISKNLPFNAGLIQITDFGGVVIKRKATINRQLNSLAVIHTLDLPGLRKLAADVNLRISRRGADELRHLLAERIQHKAVRQRYTEYLISKIQYQWYEFMRSRGQVTHPDDLPLLSCRKIIKEQNRDKAAAPAE